MPTNNSCNTYIVPTTANEVTMPSQPAFLALNSVTDLNVTGNGTVYTVIFDDEYFDQNSDYNNGNGIFTAPVTGRYQLDTTILINGNTISSNFIISIVTSNRTYSREYNRAAAALDVSMNVGCLADMDAADTAFVTIEANGEAGDTDDVFGGAGAYTFFCGFLAT